MTLLAVGESILARASRQASGAQSEVFLVESESRTSEWSEGRPENSFLSRTQGAGLRVIQNGKTGFSYTNRFDDDAISGLIADALAGAQSTAADPLRELPESKPLTSVPLDLVDPSLAAEGFDTRAGFLERLEPELKARDPRFTKILRASYREGHHREAIVTTRGIAQESEGTSVSFSLAAVAVEGNETQVGYGFQAARHASDLNTQNVVDRASEHTLSLLGGKQLPSGRYDLIFDPLIAAEVLELFATVLKADQVQKGRSFLAGKLSQRIGASSITLIDDGRLPRGLASSLFDGEGLPTQKNVLIENGVLKGYLHDSFSARKSGSMPTGNAGRGSYKSLPGPEASNFYLQPGKDSPQALIGQVRSGIYVRSLLGLHTVDTVSGEYSLGMMGQRIENGQLTHGVRGVTIAGSMLELLNQVAAVGSDLVWAGSVGAPTWWVKDISVGGNG